MSQHKQQSKQGKFNRVTVEQLQGQLARAKDALELNEAFSAMFRAEREELKPETPEIRSRLAVAGAGELKANRRAVELRAERKRLEASLALAKRSNR